MAIAAGAAPAQAQSTQSGQQTTIGSTIGDLIAQMTGLAKPRGSAAAPSGSREPATRQQPRVKKDKRTRFVIALQRSGDFNVFALTNPNRVIVDIETMRMKLPRKVRGRMGVITDFRGGRSNAKRSRIVIDVREPVVVERAVIKRNPTTRRNELILDILPMKAKLAQDKRRKKFMTNSMGLGVKAGFQPPLPRAAVAPKKLASKSFKPLVVIDPGHGGRDSGAKKNGTVEKNVVLKFSLALRDILVKSGRYRVIMTRETDRFIPLIERRLIAERNRAALFIAVHADYARSGARGATIYSLRSRVAARLRNRTRGQVGSSVLTRKEEAKIRKASADLSAIRGILADLASREVEANHNRTKAFTRSVIKTMSASTNMRANPDKQAAFKVLKTAKVPSVLIELAYVSNKRDAANLKSSKWRKRVAKSIAAAVDNYFTASISRIPL
ncbi:MAG: N-acetylmuramoyl-L-alanine amidase [Pseudomonadota bacterium]